MANEATNQPVAENKSLAASPTRSPEQQAAHARWTNQLVEEARLRQIAQPGSYLKAYNQLVRDVGRRGQIQTSKEYKLLLGQKSLLDSLISERLKTIPAEQWKEYMKNASAEDVAMLLRAKINSVERQQNPDDTKQLETSQALLARLEMRQTSMNLLAQLPEELVRVQQNESFTKIHELWMREPYAERMKRILSLLSPREQVTAVSKTDERVITQVRKAKAQILIGEMGVTQDVSQEVVKSEQGNQEVFRVKNATGKTRYTVWDENYAGNTKKVWIGGNTEPRLTADNAVLGRVYTGLNAAKATDGFMLLAKKLSEKGVLDSVRLCLNVEDVREGGLPANALVLYVTNARDEERQRVITEYLNAYDEVAKERPDVFSFTKGERQSFVESNIQRCSELVRDNISYVESPQGKESWDTDGLPRVLQVLGLKRNDSAERFIEALEAATDGFVLTKGAQMKIHEKGFQEGVYES